MKIRTKYNRIDRVIYEFDQSDIQNALEAKAGLRYKSGKRIVFDMTEDDNGRTTATLTVIWETPVDEMEPHPEGSR